MSIFVKKSYYLFLSIILSFFIYKFSVLFLNLGFYGVSRKFFVVAVILYLYKPLKEFVFEKGENKQSYIDSIDKKLEKEIIKIKGNCKVIYDSKLEKNEKSSKADLIILTDEGIFNIFLCTLNENAEISEDNYGNEIWINKISGKIYNTPAIIVRKNREILSTIANEENIVDLIVMTNNMIKVENKEDSIIEIISIENLHSYINNYYSEEEIEVGRTYRDIKKLIRNFKDDFKQQQEKIDRLRYKGFLFKGRLAVIAFFLSLYLAQIISRNY